MMCIIAEHIQCSKLTVISCQMQLNYWIWRLQNYPESSNLMPNFFNTYFCSTLKAQIHTLIFFFFPVARGKTNHLLVKREQKG